MAQWLNCKPAHKPRTSYYNQVHAVGFYSAATLLDPWEGSYPPDDTGSSGLAVAQAVKNLGYISGYRWAFGINHVLASLTLGPVLMGSVWHNDMFWPDEEGFVHATGDEVGGHEYLLNGINLRDKYVWALNSWSDIWGSKGRFKMSFDTLDALLKAEGDVVVPVL